MRDPWKSTQLSVHQMIPVPSKCKRLGAISQTEQEEKS